MALTKTFKMTVKARVDRDPEYRAALLVEGIEALLDGDVETGKIILRDYINATDGFEKLGRAVGKQPKSLMRMFSASGNPSAKNLFPILKRLQRSAGLQLQVRRN